MRKISHFQSNEPPLESLLRNLRYNKAISYIRNRAKLADIGCGYYGELLKRVHKIISLGDGYDLSVSNVPKFNKIKLIRSDLNKNKFGKPGFYTCVTSLAVIEHVNNPNKFIRRISTILKKNGILIITTPHIRSQPILEFLSRRLGLISKDEIDDHKNYYTKESLLNLITKNNFKILKLTTFELGLNLFCVASKK